MAIVKSVVRQSDGSLGNIQPGDSIGVASETGQFSRVASAALVAGNVVYAPSVTGITKAQGNASATAKAIAFCVADIASAATGVVQNNGLLTLTTAQWDAITGQTGGLTFNSQYFLSLTTAGMMTATVPTTSGQYSVTLGRALSATDFAIEIETPFQM